MNILELYKIFGGNPDISTDSRNIRPGSLFFALKGDKFNGNLFVGEALEKGAGWAIADKNECSAGERIVLVDDVLQSLQQLASHHRKQCRFKILAITGSNGKTTTKELCFSVLSKKYKVFATHGNLNNHIGVPLTLLAMPPDTDIGIIEMGANHQGEIALLCNIALPDYGLITNIGKAHLEGFGSIKDVARAKGELFHYLSRNGGTIFANAGNAWVREIIPPDSKNVVRYNTPDTRWAEIYDSELFLGIAIHDQHNTVLLKSQLVGIYNQENLLAAYTVGKFFGIPIPELSDAVASCFPSYNRSQYLKTSGNEVILDAYNANPSSMKAAIENFMTIQHPEKLLILGEMLEIGESSAQEHEDVINMLLKNSLQQVICIGGNFELPAKSAGFIWYANVTLLMEALSHSPVRGKFILIKGSRGNQLEKILGHL
jgi:UDP-N-acetylmuramoyl-tripeptide--D-alanyl-D-alanine ligase